MAAVAPPLPSTEPPHNEAKNRPTTTPISQNPFTDTQFNKDPCYKPSTKVVNLDLPIDDPEKESFRTWHGNKVFVTGFMLFFPNHLTFLGKPGFYIEDLFVNESYRRKGFGTLAK
ncbi:unnamed protein product [Vicia faba]|uniref:N-acetyltransferase domain-containing protein n=1 Tax=Vicia faba TaxID=3906 RepID=A0AAV1AUI4_VICFA|nr:unnamed protein product [Vicia faba]